MTLFVNWVQTSLLGKTVMDKGSQKRLILVEGDVIAGETEGLRFVRDFFAFMDQCSIRCLKKERKKKEKRHKCPQCELSFSFPNKLRIHIKSTHSKSHSCERCDAHFDRFNQLRTHMAFVHRTCHYCHLCSYSSSVKSELKKHIVRNHENGVSCTIDGCGATVAYRLLKRHIQEVHKSKDSERSKRCGENAKIFDADEVLVHSSHRESVDPPGNFDSQPHFEDNEDVCGPSDLPKLPGTSCDKGLDAVSSATKSNTPPSFLATCSTFVNDDEQSNYSFGPNRGVDDFSDEEAATEESSTFSCAAVVPNSEDVLEGIYACGICSKRFHKNCSLRRHRQRVHDKTYKEKPKEKKFMCTSRDCNKGFSSLAKLADHRASHCEEQLVKCENCVKYFKSRGALAKHLKRYHLLSIRDIGVARFVTFLKPSKINGSIGPESALKKGSGALENVAAEEMGISDSSVTLVAAAAQERRELLDKF